MRRRARPRRCLARRGRIHQSSGGHTHSPVARRPRLAGGMPAFSPQAPLALAADPSVGHTAPRPFTARGARPPTNPSRRAFVRGRPPGRPRAAPPPPPPPFPPSPVRRGPPARPAAPPARAVAPTMSEREHLPAPARSFLSVEQGEHAPDRGVPSMVLYHPMVLYQLVRWYDHGTAGFCFLLFFPFWVRVSNPTMSMSRPGREQHTIWLCAPDREWRVPKSARRSRRDPNPDGPETTTQMCIKTIFARARTRQRGVGLSPPGRSSDVPAADPEVWFWLWFWLWGLGWGRGWGWSCLPPGRLHSAKFHRARIRRSKKTLQRGRSAMRIRGAKKRAAKSA